ncbi:MAG TPA: metallohydrolase [Noviherbaspirillum sp.]|uniref:metallohydrolase n=1 Tax=Noviherbaspirillum sp. TaxID=1926288 RepID=UPI002B495BAC|nr:metallohydrolase [Noviherbaspirillum sp.]HJV88289.1 metallohydrolase [Noviherbaspirillum sp.]
MKPEIIFFPVDNGDMTLIKLESERRILLDINIRQANDDIVDVATKLRKELKTDANDRPYVDVMVLSHPDQDHCRGFQEHFHVGPIEDYCDKDNPKKIIIREMWSSPLVFRRSSKKDHTLSDDAQAWNKEARRRVNLHKEKKTIGADGNRILILGEDVDGKTDDIPAIVLKTGSSVSTVCGEQQSNFKALLLAPLKSNDEDEEEVLSKNESSVIMNYAIGYGREPEAVKFLSGGDAEVAIWEKLWKAHKGNVKVLQYNLLMTPHHCSWHTLSWDSWSELRRKAVVSQDARNAIGQALAGATIVASSKAIKDDDNDPPCIRAKEEYESIINDTKVKGEFWNTATYPSSANPDLLRFEVSEGGLKKVKTRSSDAGAVVGGGIIGSQPLSHG